MKKNIVTTSSSPSLKANAFFSSALRICQNMNKQCQLANVHQICLMKDGTFSIKHNGELRNPLILSTVQFSSPLVSEDPLLGVLKLALNLCESENSLLFVDFTRPIIDTQTGIQKQMYEVYNENNIKKDYEHEQPITASTVCEVYFKNASLRFSINVTEDTFTQALLNLLSNNFGKLKSLDCYICQKELSSMLCCDKCNTRYCIFCIQSNQYNSTFHCQQKKCDGSIPIRVFTGYDTSRNETTSRRSNSNHVTTSPYLEEQFIRKV